MNWKVLALIPALTLVTVLPAYSKTPNKTQNTASAVKVSQASQPGESMKKPNVIKSAHVTKKTRAIANHSTVLRIGSKGESVKVAQNSLKQQGFYTGTVNGVFDNQTREAVIKFQQSKKLRADGIIGRQTLAALK
ncbi:peptidoglycan-binding protein [Nostoc sp. CENA67]|uniref:Peptidoglycan-binding protein n=1 Tax=Amazonocrinis nigriterrae CENA67 TaxID=2794033 RepID=A0A8J7L9X3_9NOST|nr:peptidoglycan-binding protein [Amazonocrinis nigriterrae]MBH8564550.1 peptidoglycan-binding protein [Amazonocrinis nigriterrae CENA67]